MATNEVPVVVVQDLEGYEFSSPINEEGDIGVWSDYRIRNRYEKSQGRYMLGITSPNGFQGAEAAFVQLSAPTLLWISSWTASKLGEKPVIPNPANVPSDYVLLYETPVTEMITVTGDGNKVYRISGTYVYGKKNPADQVFNDVKYPQPPWLVPDSDRNIETSSLVGGLITTATGSKLQPELGDLIPTKLQPE